MDLTLLSGVVRNRRMAGTVSSRPTEYFNTEGTQEPNNRFPNHPVAARIFHLFERNNICRRFSLRVHKFSFQWDLVLHFAICIFSLIPFMFTGERLYSFLPLSVWIFYHVLFMIYPRQANLVIPGFGRLKHSFKATIEDFFSPKLLPVLSFSFLLVTLSLAVTGHRLGGPPLCFQPCGECLARWDHAVEIGKEEAGVVYESYRQGCGYANGKEMLALYTMAQTSFLLFVVVVVAMSICLAWRIAEEEHTERRQAEDILKQISQEAYDLRHTLIKEYGSPASSIRPEGSATWIFFGIIAALTFTLLGWHHWYVLPPSKTASLLIILNLFTILMTTLILHLGFFGRILALYKRNYLRVQCLTSFLVNMKETEIDHWWNCRNFVLNDDLSLDYDIGGLAVSMTFLMDVFLFLILMRQIYKDGSHLAMLEPPGSYCAYACLYITCCLIKIFTLATNTYEEQHHHIMKLQQLSSNLALRSQAILNTYGYPGEYSPVGYGNVHLNIQQSATSQGLEIQQHWIEGTSNAHQSKYNPLYTSSYDEYGNDDGPIFIDTLDVESNPHHTHHPNHPSPHPVALQIPNNTIANTSNDLMMPLPGSPSMQQLSHQKSFRNAVIGSPRGMTKSKSLLRQQQQLGMSSSGGGSGSHGNLSHLPTQPQTQGENNPNSFLDFQAVVNQNLSSLTTNNNTNNSTSNTFSLPFPSEVHPSLANFYYSQSTTTNNDHNHPNHNNSSDDPSQPLLPHHSEKPTNVLSIINPIDINNNNNNTSATTTAASIPKPLPPVRQQSTSLENYRQTIAEIISQIRKYDPYPCILGIPVMPALFNGSKFYIFISFILIGVRTMISCFRQF